VIATTPVIIAQAAATLAEMYHGRFWLALGSGEALNEHVTGNRWPPKQERQQRLRECVEILRALWRGERVVHRGIVQAVDARVYSLPDQPPMIYGAAVSDDTAEWVGGWADAMITTGRPRIEMEKTIAAFRRAGLAKPIAVQHVLSWAASDADARRQAHEQWRFAALPAEDDLWNLRTPEDFDRATTHMSLDAVAAKIPASADLDFHVERLRAYVELGVDHVYLFSVGRNQREFIQRFGESVLPKLRTASAGNSRGKAQPLKKPGTIGRD
jgi:G6PDH family F420-dependent oxidoreductase